MKNLKKFAALLLAAAMLLACGVTVSAGTVVNGVGYDDAFGSFAKNEDIVSGSGTKTRTINCGGTATCILEVTASNSYIRMRQDDWATSGTRALNIYCFASESDYAIARFLPGVTAVDNEYHLSFNAISNSGAKCWLDYATLNYVEKDGKARRHSSGEMELWTSTSVTPTLGTNQWKHYEAIITGGGDSPEFRICAMGGGVWHIDDVCIKDKTGKILFSEDFELGVAEVEEPVVEPVVEPTEGVHVLSTKSDGWERDGYDPGNNIRIVNQADGQGKRLRIASDGSANIARYRIPLPAKASDNTYYITYDYERTGDNRSPAAASVDLLGYNIYGAGNMNNFTDGYHVVSGTGDYLYLACEGWGGANIDNIVVRDASGKVLFSEDFENFEEKYSYYTYETKLQGLSANGRSGKIYLSWRNPDRSDIASIKIYENDTELSDYTAGIDTESGNVNIVEVAAASGSTHEFDVRMITTGNEVFHNTVTGKEGTPFIYTTKTVDGEPISGWVLRYADGESVKALGKLEYDTNNKAEGTRSLHINPNITYTSANQPSAADKTTVKAQYSDGARINLDTSASGIEAGKTYKLSWKQKGHRAGPYYVQLVMNDHAENIGKMTVNSEYVTTPWQDREIEFTVDSVGSTPMIRFEFSNGANDFWLDDVKLTESGSNVNLLENGTFEPLSSFIYNAELYEVEQVENEYVILGTPEYLSGNTLIKSNVRIENISETNPVSADVYTALYKDGRLISVDKVTPSAVQGGTAAGGSVISIPAVNDGEYSVKVFIWKPGEIKPLKKVKTLHE